MYHLSISVSVPTFVCLLDPQRSVQRTQPWRYRNLQNLIKTKLDGNVGAKSVTSAIKVLTSFVGQQIVAKFYPHFCNSIIAKLILTTE